MVRRHYPVLPRLSAGYPGSGGRYPRVTLPFAAVRPPEGKLLARLACLIHAANVHSEPGSNPSIFCKPHRRNYKSRRTIRHGVYEPQIQVRILDAEPSVATKRNGIVSFRSKRLKVKLWRSSLPNCQRTFSLVRYRVTPFPTRESLILPDFRLRSIGPSRIFSTPNYFVPKCHAHKHLRKKLFSGVPLAPLPFSDAEPEFRLMLGNRQAADCVNCECARDCSPSMQPG